MIDIPVEIHGQQLRIQERKPSLFDKFRTKDIGRKGRLQIILGRLKHTEEWRVQAYRMNLMDYKNAQNALDELNKLDDKYGITHYLDAKYLIADWFKKNR